MILSLLGKILLINFLCQTNTKLANSLNGKYVYIYLQVEIKKRRSKNLSLTLFQGEISSL